MSKHESAKPFIDQAALEEVRALAALSDNPNLLLDLLDLLVPLIHETMASIKSGVSANDKTALTHAAHKLKSSSANLGLLIVADCCQRLESTGKTEVDPEVLSSLAKELISLCERALVEIESLKILEARSSRPAV